MTRWIRVAGEDEINEGERKIVDIRGTSIGVLHVDGAYYAIWNYCAHEGGPVRRGNLQRAIDADFVASGERISEYVSDKFSISCPWHGWEYDLETGEHLGDSSISVPTYEVKVQEGYVYVKIK